MIGHILVAHVVHVLGVGHDNDCLAVEEFISGHESARRELLSSAREVQRDATTAASSLAGCDSARASTSCKKLRGELSGSSSSGYIFVRGSVISLLAPSWCRCASPPLLQGRSSRVLLPNSHAHEALDLAAIFAKLFYCSEDRSGRGCRAGRVDLACLFAPRQQAEQSFLAGDEARRRRCCKYQRLKRCYSDDIYAAQPNIGRRPMPLRRVLVIDLQCYVLMTTVRRRVIP